ncbi:branched-chain amino acid ABC transporter substrate-binding protein [Paenibacillus sedimenti]|uniref:Branched-chain amino acid ABC transporter substrate-binding protein n=1 Tax=Paenibacillus sedimenti TaxID=2770274 RepID=A0A926KSL5_9BACL|nr:branched-chain amino acid ABC transporter substrate-binding protein [Paenibacillus sedimenti]MBD0383220.1 branched-chain amino acid ABC transporter substrate-binding protein [Paenibacillus sedimenti]
MNLKKTALMISVSALALGLLAGCGNGNTSTSTSTSTATGTAETAKPGSGGAKTVIKIATQSPLSGGSAVQGEAIKLGAQLSLDDHKAEFDKLGFELQLVPYDDQGDPKKGVANAEIIGADQSILGIVGHMNSGVAIPSSVVYEKYNAVMVSPSNTATEVTDRNLKVVNRIVARDDFQGPAAAEYAVKTVGAKNIFVIQDKTAYGQGLADAFKDAATKLGATIVGYEGITVGEKDFNGVLNIALSKKPDFVFFGGLYGEGGLLIKQARDKGIMAPFMGGDAWDSQGLVDVAGDKVKDALYASIATDITKTAEGKKWADQYKAKFSKSPDGYSAYAYDCMTVILNGIKTAAAANGGKVPTRDKVRDAVRATKDFQGLATKISFDGKGDNTYAKVFIYKFGGPAYPGSMISEVSK